MRVLIIDDHPAIRVGMRQQILREWPLADVLEAPTMARRLALLSVRKPDLLVLDLWLPDAHGIAAASRVLRSLGGLPLLVLCHEPERAEAALLLQMGVAAYLSKPLLASEFMPAVQRLLAGGRFISSSVAHRFLSLPALVTRSPGS